MLILIIVCVPPFFIEGAVMFANVYLIQSNFMYETNYTYRIPEALEDSIYPGVFVNVPFGKGNRSDLAIVWELLDTYEGKYALKDITGIEESIHPLNKNEMDLADQIRDMYLSTIGEAVKCMIPPAGNKGQLVNVASLARTAEVTKELIDSGVFRSIKHIKVLELLYEGPMPVNEIMSLTGVSQAIISTLKKNGYINIEKVNIKEKPGVSDRKVTSKPLVLNYEQQAAYENISRLVNSGRFSEVLLKGVTGSGKTEVYLHLIADVIRKDRSAILLVPEISLTPQMVERLIGRFGNKVAILHSRMTDNERNIEWNRIREGMVSVAVGARSCVFAPFDNISLIIIDEEQEGSYKSDEQSPRYHAAEIAVFRAKQMGATVIYGSATPGINTYYRAKKNEIYLCQLNNRANQSSMPPVEVVDMRNENRIGDNIFSSRLLAEMKRNYEEGNQTVLFINRRGFSSQLMCIGCGKTMKCGKCNIPMTYHMKSDRLICHYCGNTVVAPKKCPACQSDAFMKKGMGTEKIEDALKRYFPDSTVVRMDTDTTSVKDGHSKLIQKFRDEKADFLVGTQMIAKGHDFPLVTLVGVINADSLINIQDYRAAEKAFQLLTQVAGRAGRDRLPGKVIIQVFDTDDYAIKAATDYDYEGFYANEIIIRERLWYPPFCHLGAISFSGTEDKGVYDFAAVHMRLLHELLTNMKVAKNIAVEMLGPTRSGIPKINNKYRWRLIIKSSDDNVLRALLREYLTRLRNDRKNFSKDISVSADINPGFMI